MFALLEGTALDKDGTCFDCVKSVKVLVKLAFDTMFKSGISCQQLEQNQ